MVVVIKGFSIKPGARTPDRSQLRLADLKARPPSSAKLMNVKVLEAITRLAQTLGASKTEVVVASLDTELDIARAKVARKTPHKGD